MEFRTTTNNSRLEQTGNLGLGSLETLPAPDNHPSLHSSGASFTSFLSVAPTGETDSLHTISPYSLAPGFHPSLGTTSSDTLVMDMNIEETPQPTVYIQEMAASVSSQKAKYVMDSLSEVLRDEKYYPYAFASPLLEYLYQKEGITQDQHVEVLGRPDNLTTYYRLLAIIMRAAKNNSNTLPYQLMKEFFSQRRECQDLLTAINQSEAKFDTSMQIQTAPEPHTHQGSDTLQEHMRSLHQKSREERAEARRQGSQHTLTAESQGDDPYQQERQKCIQEQQQMLEYWQHQRQHQHQQQQQQRQQQQQYASQRISAHNQSDTAIDQDMAKHVLVTRYMLWRALPMNLPEKLFSKRVLSFEQLQKIDAQETNTEKMKLTINFVLTQVEAGNRDCYKNFKEAIAESSLTGWIIEKIEEEERLFHTQQAQRQPTAARPSTTPQAPALLPSSTSTIPSSTMAASRASREPASSWHNKPLDKDDIKKLTNTVSCEIMKKVCMGLFEIPSMNSYQHIPHPFVAMFDAFKDTLWKVGPDPDPDPTQTRTGFLKQARRFLDQVEYAQFSAAFNSMATKTADTSSWINTITAKQKTAKTSKKQTSGTSLQDAIVLQENETFYVEGYGKMKIEDLANCDICFNPFLGEVIAFGCTGGHVACSTCVTRLLRTLSLAKNCPICREPLDEEKLRKRLS